MQHRKTANVSGFLTKSEEARAARFVGLLDDLLY